MEPIRIVEKKGNKYLVEWKGNNNKNSWETKANLGISYRLFLRSRIIFQNENIRTVKTFPTLRRYRTNHVEYEFQTFLRSGYFHFEK